MGGGAIFGRIEGVHRWNSKFDLELSPKRRQTI
jgi:hypothetical protein